MHDAAPRVLATIAVRLRELQTGVHVTLTGWRATAQLVPLALALIFLSPLLFVGSLLALVPFAAALGRLRNAWRAANERAQALAERLQQGEDELVRNLDLWRAYGAGSAAERFIDDCSRRTQRAAGRVDAGRAALSGFNEVLGAVALLGAVAIAARAGAPVGDGAFVAFVAVLLMAYRPLRDLGDVRAWRARTQVAIAALEKLVTAPHVESHLPPPEPASDKALRPLVCDALGARRFGPRTSFTVEAGEFVCLTGPTGSGKTTLLRVLLGLEPAVGTLTYGERELSGVPVGPAWRPFAWVPQDAPLVTAPLLENVALFDGDANRAKKALERLGAQPLLDRLGSEQIGPAGRPLSGGERRLVAVARALCSELPVLLLDEPTEGLDAHAEQTVLQALERIRGQRSVLVVTHRSELFVRADRIVHIGSTAHAHSPVRAALASGEPRPG
jgi:ABC-type multidrug transport system fused ATPase/permease subunit